MAPPKDTYRDASGGKASSSDKAIIEAATIAAIDLVKRVITALKTQTKGPADAHFDRLVYAYFKTNSAAHLEEILEVFKGAKSTLNKNTTYIADRRSGQTYHGKTEQTHTTQSSLGIDFFNAPAAEQPATIVHESIHRSSNWTGFARFRYGPLTTEKYAFNLYEDFTKWSQATYKTVKDWVDTYVAFAQGFDDQDYFGKWGGLHGSITVRQMIGRHKDLGPKIVEAKGHLHALGLYTGSMDASFNDEFSKAMHTFIKDYWKEFTSGGIYKEDLDWKSDDRLMQLRRARQSIAPERRPR